MRGRMLVAACALVVLAGCGRDAASPGSQTPSTTTPAATTSHTTAAPIAPTVTPIAPNPSLPLSGTCTQGEASSTCAPDPEQANAAVGLTEAQAAAAATTHGWPFRVVERDGEELLVTQDYVANRLNVALRGGTVERAWFG